MAETDIVKLKFQFFFERGKEMLNRKALDSYRVRAMNPKELLVELLAVIADFETKRSIRFDPTVKDVAKELEIVLESADSGLQFPRFEKNLLRTILKTLKEQEYKKGALLVRFLLNDNQGYHVHLLAELKQLLLRPELDKYEEDLSRIDHLLGFLMTDRVRNGFSRTYLKDRFYKHFKKKSGNQERHFDAFSTDILRSREMYSVFFKAWIKNPEELPASEIGLEIEDHIPPEEVQLNREHHFFLERDKNLKFIPIAVQAHDFTAALYQATSKFSGYQDLVNLGLIDNHMTRTPKACIVHSDSGKYRIFEATSELDGNYWFDDVIFKDFVQSLHRVIGRSIEIKDRLGSALRYLRMGNESPNIEYGFLNYWIGLEYLYSSPLAEGSTISRIKYFFPKLHIVHYYQRKILYLLGMMERKGITEIEGMTLDRDVLTNPDSCEKIIALYRFKEPAIYLRTLQLNRLLQKSERKKDMDRHLSNLEYHLTRIYRIRNQIVHEASVDMSIEMIAANLKYYLIFSLERIVWTMEAYQDVEAIEDVFVFYEANAEKMKSLENLSKVCNLMPFKTMVE